MKKYIGYYIIGAASKKDAQDEKGLLLWSRTKPSAFKRFFSQFLLGIYWVDKEKMLEEKGKTKQSSNAAVQMTKLSLESKTVKKPTKQ